MMRDELSVWSDKQLMCLATLSICLGFAAGALIHLLTVGVRWAPLLGGAGVSVLVIGLALRQRHCVSAWSTERVVCWLSYISGFFGVAFFAVNVGPFSLFPFRFLLLLSWFLLLLRVLGSSRPVVFHLRPVRFYLLFLAVWLGYSILSMAWAASAIEAARHVIFLLMGGSTIFFVAVYFTAGEDQERLFWTWMGVFALLLILGCWEHVTGHHLPSSPYHGATGSEFYAFWPTGTFGNPNNYATYLALSIPFGLSLARYSRRPVLRVASLGSTALAAYLILAVGSRGNLIAVLMMVAFLTLFLVRGSRRLRLVIGATVVLVCLSVVYPTPIRTTVGRVAERVGSLVTDAPTQGGSVNVRWNLLRNGLHFVHATGGMGVGAGNAEYWMANMSVHNTFGIMNPHNWWLEILVNYGILLFAGYVLFYLSLVRALWRAWRRSLAKDRMICEALLVSLVGFFVASMSPSSAMAFTPHWLLFAFALTFLGYHRARERAC